MTPFLRLIKLIAPFKWWMALGVLLSFLTTGSSVGLMAMSAYLISKAALAADLSDIALVITVVRLLAILRVVFRYLERYFTHSVTFRILAHLRVWFFAAIEPLAPARLMQHHSGDLLTRFVGDIEILENFYVRVVVPPVAAVLVTLLACAILGVFDGTLAVVLLVFLVLTGVILPLVSRWITKQPSAALITTRAELNELLVDEVQGIADLLSFDMEQQHQARVLALSRALNRSQERIAVLLGLTNGLGALFASLAALTVLMLAVPLVNGGQIDGVFLALLPLTAIASFEALQPLPQAIQQMESSLAASRRLFELIDTPAKTSDPMQTLPLPSKFSINLEHVSFRYSPNDPPVFDDISLSIPHGAHVAIVGPSGSGKSTLVNLLLRFWDVDAGQICIGGQDVREYRMDDVRSLVGVVPQNVYLFNATLRDNLLLANPDATDEQIAAACAQAQLSDFIDALPAGYETLIGENGLLLSGGERQRIAVARVILKNAPILILDEATANLDALTAQKLIRSLESFTAGRTVLIISHHRVALEHVEHVFALGNEHNY